ncbi:hypothetical protein L208DRAFT_1406092, partial [Tricholoma matsutake]
MLFIKHFATFLFASLVLGSTVLAMPTKGAKPDSIEKGKIYQGKVHHTVPAAGKSKDGRHPMVTLGHPHPDTGHVHVGILTHHEDPNGGTKPESEYGLPGNGHVKQSHHTIHKDHLEHLADTHSQEKKDHQMSDANLKKLKGHTEAN